jgi:para-nitrobenzyl esterase
MGPVIGWASDGVASFKGIPYAAPPLGDLRFSPPEAPEPFKEPYPALKYGPIAHQFFKKNDIMKPPEGTYVISEDCLSLNIFAPENAGPASKLPVFVFVHGGGFSMGSSGQPKMGTLTPKKMIRSLYDGSSLAKEGIVVATVNYRLGAMGFFASRETYDKYGTTGNWGLLDQIQALKWIRDNIEAFGGDPGKITLGGESAGSISVSALMISPLAKGLFHRLILQSGTVLSLNQVPIARGDLDKAIRVGEMLMSMLGLEDSPEGLAALRKVDAGALSKVSALDMNFNKISPFALSPIRDGRVLPVDAIEVLKAGDYDKVSVLMGSNGDEGSLFVPRSADIKEINGIELSFLGPEGLKAFKKLPLYSSKIKPFERARKAVAYAVFSAGTKRLADMISQLAPTYVYRFEYASVPAKIVGLGAHHAGELPFVFKSLPTPNLIMGLCAKRLAGEIQARWASFIKNGDPNPPKVAPEAKWPVYDAKDPRVLILDKKIRAAKMPDQTALDLMAEAFYGKI